MPISERCQAALKGGCEVRKGLPRRCASILLTIALVGMMVGCYPVAPYPLPVPPPEYWRPTADYSTTDRDLTLVVMTYGFFAWRGQWYGTLFYAVLAPQGLSGWQVTPGPVGVGDDSGPLGTGQASTIESAGGVTVGALVLSPFGWNANALRVRITTMEAKNLTTGEVQEVKGDWQLRPLGNMSPGSSGGTTTLRGAVPPVTGAGSPELTHQGITLKYAIDGGYRGPPLPQPPPATWQPWQWWVLGQQFWFNEPVPHDVFVLVTSEGEVSRVTADEYLRRGFRIQGS
ncbi:MAG: hypothetical protein KJ624_04940 [Chloroflexi bacterium]|nr:hypothetical protein [Chloroflexota bacterium]